MTDQQNAALEPCPFCGGEARIEQRSQNQCWVECMNQDCRAMGKNCEGPQGASAAWNTRPAPAGAEAVREAARRLVRDCIPEGGHGSKAPDSKLVTACLAALAKAPSTGEGGESVDDYVEDLYQAVKDGVQLSELGVQVEALLATWCQSKGYTTPTLATPQPAPTAAEDGLREAAEAGYRLSTWAACVRWDGGRNEKDWLDGLRERIEKVQALAALRAKPEACGGK